MKPVQKHMGPDQLRAFELYYGLGRYRSYRKLERVMGSAYNMATLSRWGRRWKWNEMVSKRDLEIKDGRRADYRGEVLPGETPVPRTELGRKLEDTALVAYRSGDIEITIAGIIVRFSHFFDGLFAEDELGQQKCTIPIKTPADVAVLAAALKDVGEVYRLVMGDRLKREEAAGSAAMSELIKEMAAKNPKALASLLRGPDAEVVSNTDAVFEEGGAHGKSR